MKLFVTGAHGFIGRELCRLALSRGHEVLGLHRDSPANLIDGCQGASGSLEDPPWDLIEEFRPDTALHLAWIATPGVYLDSPDNGRLTEQSERLFRGLIELGVHHIAGTGTCIEYAPSHDPLREDTSPLAPSFPYSRAKIETCQRLKVISSEARTTWSWFRLFYPYGQGEHHHRLPTALILKLLKGEPVELKTPSSVKDYIHVSDAAEAILTGLECRLPGAINIGTGTGVKILDLADTIAAIAGVDPKLITQATPPAIDGFPVTVADTKKIQSTGWNPRIRLAVGLEQLMQSLQSQTDS